MPLVYRGAMRRGFTLVEMSIVLVIIGLIIGGVLVGRDLIQASTIRSQISQIEKYQTAVKTFRNKYDGLPGDLFYTQASAFGFFMTGCDGSVGNRNGDGILESTDAFGWPWYVIVNLHAGGETTHFWSDLSAAKLIQDQLPSNGVNVNCYSSIAVAPTYYFPYSNFRDGSSVYAYGYKGANWLGLSTAANIGLAGRFYSS